MPPCLRFGTAELRPAERRLLVDGREVALKPRAFDLLVALVERGGRVVAKEELLDLVWPGRVVEDNNLHVHVSALRRVLGPDAIRTVPGRGYQFAAAGSAEPPAAPARPSVLRGGLPEQPLALVGREADLAALAQRVAAQRLVTLVGAGGIGKTRLAQALALRVGSRFADGASMVELASVSEPALVAATVAKALGERLPGQRAPLEELVDLLRGRHLLLVLDNCEHLVGAAAQLAEALLRQAPQVHLLVTSQERLHCADEHLYPVAPLAVPDDDALESALAAGAVQLFVERSAALQPGFVLDAGNAADVAEICRRLDGLPLAIELAAARVRLLGVRGVRERLGERLRLLTDGARAGLPRHQTLRETLGWSHGLLGEAERVAFRRLGVFAGSFALATAERVLDEAGFDSWAVLHHLGGLVDKSLVASEPGEPPRLRLLESARAYALERLQDAGESERLRRRHAEAMLELFRRLDDDEWTLPTPRRLALALPDIDNLRAALDWAAQAPDAAPLHIELAACSAWLWQPLGLRVEGQDRLQRAGARIDAATPPAVEARWQNARVLAAMPLPGRPERVGAERAVALYRELGDRRRLYVALGTLARVTALSRDFEPCRRVLAELEAAYDPAWPPYARAPLLTARGYLAHFGADPAAALPPWSALLQIIVDFGDPWMERTVQIFLEQATQMLGRFEEAVERGRALIARQRGLPFRSSLTMPLANLCQALTELGDLEAALQAGRETLDEGLRDGQLWIALDIFALLAGRRGRLRAAGLAFGCSDAELARRSAVRPMNEQRAYETTMAALREAMAPEQLTALLAEGAALTPEQAARAALDLPAPPQA